jgi:lysophospholipase L1-like esterase
MRMSAQMVTIMVGANDFCAHMCYLKNFSFMRQLHKDSLIKALNYLRDNMPRTIVNLVPPPREYVRNHTQSTAQLFISVLCMGARVYNLQQINLLWRRQRI